MLSTAWKDHEYTQIIGDVSTLSVFNDEPFGIRTFWDLQQNQEKHGDENWQDKMMQLEMRVAQIPEYRNVAFFHHLLLTK